MMAPPANSVPPSPISGLPMELEAFLALPGPRSLIVRGPPGSGKTTLALALLESFGGRRVLITGRVSQPEILRQFPWLGRHGECATHIVEAGDLNIGPVPPDTVEALRSHPSSSTELPPRSPNLVPASLRDARDRRGTDWRARRDLQGLPPELRTVLGQPVSADPSIIVIDSWDAVVEEYVGWEGPRNRELPDRAEMERTLLRQVRRGADHLVLVLERDEPSRLDYLVDGIVSTSWEPFEGHLERWIRIPKLRGERVRFQTYPFSLEDGRFRCVKPAIDEEAMSYAPPDADPRPTPRTFWPGSEAFVKAFGRPSVPGVLIVEHSDDMLTGALASMITPFILATLKEKGRAFIAPGPNAPTSRLFEAARGVVSHEQLAERVRLVAPSLRIPSEHPLRRCLLPVPLDMDPVPRSGVPRFPKAQEFLAGDGKKVGPLLVLVSTEALREIGELTGRPYTPENLPRAIQAFMGGGPVLVALISRIDDPLIQSTKATASIHLRVHMRKGRPVIYGLHPLTHGHLMVFGPEAGAHPYDLLELV
jgi:hypothetical protein